MKTIVVYFSDGDHIITQINGTIEEIREYYLGKYFNLGAEGDEMKKAVFVHFEGVEWEYYVQCWNGLEFQTSKYGAETVELAKDAERFVRWNGAIWCNPDKSTRKTRIEKKSDIPCMNRG